MTQQSSLRAPRRKVTPGRPRKPHRDFPLFPHATGRWAKKVKGKLVYFGKIVDDPHGENGLKLWLEQRDDLLAGRKPRPADGRLAVARACDGFMTHKEHQLQTGEIAKRTYADYFKTCQLIVDTFGRTRPVDDLTPDDFLELRERIAKGHGIVTIANEVRRVRIVFKFLFDAGLIDRPVRFGPTFKQPSARSLRLDRQRKPERLFSAAEIRQVLAEAPVNLSAMILLGVNCGFGNEDCASVPLDAIDLKRGWVDFPRPKTGAPRRCPLWPETIEALEASLNERPTPKSEEAAGLFFLTRCGQKWGNGRNSNPVSAEFAKLLRRLELQKTGRGFYSLRHSFRTQADAVKDQPAANLIMGHTDNSMPGNYRHAIDDQRLLAVTDHVRNWLFETAQA